MFPCYSTRRCLDCYRQPNILHGALIGAKTERTKRDLGKSEEEKKRGLPGINGGSGFAEGRNWSSDIPGTLFVLGEKAR